MSRRKPRKTPPRAVLLRNIGFGLAVILGGVGIWLIVTGGNSTQRIEIGVLTGLWGLLLGAICGRRLVVAEPSAASDERASAELAVPESAPVDRAEAAAAQRAFAAELQEMLRREFGAAVNDAVNREVSELRTEIAELRQELLEKVGGELRLERIETTRLIGSDLEAMRDEVRRLKPAPGAALLAADADFGDESEAVQPAPVRSALDAGPETARIPRIPAAEGAVDADAAPAEPPDVAGAPAPQPEGAAGPALQPAPQSAPQPAPQPASHESADPFAGLPRLTPFTEFPLDPVDTSGAHAQPSPEDQVAAAAHGAAQTTSGNAPAPTAESEARAPRHRRKRSDDPAGQQLLAQLLAREGIHD